MADPIQLCHNCEHISPSNWKYCHKCGDKIQNNYFGQGTKVSYKKLDQYYESISKGYHIYSFYAGIIAGSLALLAILVITANLGIDPIWLIPSFFGISLFSMISLFYNPWTDYRDDIFAVTEPPTFGKNQKIINQCIAFSVFLGITVTYANFLLALFALLIWHPKGKVSQMEVIESLLRIAADGNQEAAVTSFALLASIDVSQLENDDLYIFYNFIEEHPDIAFEQIRPDQLLAVVRNLYGEARGTERRKVIRLIIESSDDPYTLEKFYRMIIGPNDDNLRQYAHNKIVTKR